MYDSKEGFRKSLVATAMGEENADLVVKNCTLVDVYSGKLRGGLDVAVKGNRIALVGDCEPTIDDSTKVLETDGKYIAPGFLDGHVHIDDSMGTVKEFAREVLPRGTTGVFMDPHEIANVLGLKGVRFMMEEARNVPLRVYTSIPSCVPATSPKFETTGGSIDVEDVREALQWDRTVALGEVMDYPSVLRGEEEIHAMIRETLSSGKVVEGHAPDLSEEELNAYIGAGVSSCHESTRKEEGLEKLRLGMCLMIREGFASIKNLSELIRVVTEEDVDTSRICLVTDDRHPEDIINEGHMDHVVRRAIEEGVDPIEVIQMSTINTATHFKVDQVVGGIAPGRFADMVILEDLDRVSVSEVIADGRIVASNGEFIGKFGSYKYPEDAKRSVKLSRKLDRHDFTVQAEQKRDTAKVRVMGVDESSPVTENLTEELPIDDGSLQTSVDRDLAKVAVVERHKKTGNIGLGFVTGFGFEEGATATTIAHDSHNLLIVGMDEGDMAVAANKLAEVGGGVVTVREGEILRLLKLPIGGLMSDQPLERTREKMSKLSKSWNELGCKMDFPFPTIVLLALPVLPKLRITDKGLVDTVSFEKIDLLID